MEDTLPNANVNKGVDMDAMATPEIPSFFTLLREDVECVFHRDPAARSRFEVLTTYPGVHALLLQRIAHRLWKSGLRYPARVVSFVARLFTNIDIHPGARIGHHFFIDHGTGVVIGETAEIGDRVRIYQGVTLGAASLRDSRALRGQKRHPTVEDDVTIYAGATILGGETVIGAGCVIGGNVWLTESVPPGSQVVAEPARYVVRPQSPERQSAVQLRWDL